VQLPCQEAEYGLPIPVSSGEWMAVYHIYADESGKLSGKEPYTSLCGYVGPIAAWGQLAEAWNKCRFQWQIPPIHMSRIMHPDRKEDAWNEKWREWGDGWVEKRDIMLAELGGIIHDVGVICIGAVVDADAYRSVRADPSLSLLWGDSNVFALHEVMMRGIKRIETVDKISPVSLVVDDDPEHAKDFYAHYTQLRTHSDPMFSKVRERMHAISFCDDEHYPGLQAADMIAWSARAWMVDNGEDHKIAEPHELLRLLTHSSMYQPKVYTADILRQLGANNAASIARLKNANQTI
jgi:hypothetical protein